MTDQNEIADAPLRQNFELKARLDSRVEAEKVAARLATTPARAEHQLDTYFQTRHGRLKLREINRGVQGQLIWYDRVNKPETRSSQYRLVQVEDCPGLKAALTAAWGVLLTVEKNRQISWYENVRIHVDQVHQLGDFLEFEAVVGPTNPEAICRERISYLAGEFKVTDASQVSCSYSDLLHRKLGQ